MVKPALPDGRRSTTQHLRMKYTETPKPTHPPRRQVVQDCGIEEERARQQWIDEINLELLELAEGERQRQADKNQP
jgi:hypothetical protein